MKNLTRITLCASLMFAMTMTAQAENLLTAEQNGFETDITGWAVKTGTDFCSQATDKGYGGSASSLKVSIPENSDAAAVEMETTPAAITLEAGKSYKATAWVYIEAETTKLKSVQFNLAGGTWVGGSTTQKAAIGIGAWKKVESVLAPLETDSLPQYKLNVKLNLEPTDVSAATVYIDNVEFYEFDPATAPVASRGFETADVSSNVGAAGWAEQGTLTGCLSRTIDKFKSGTASMKVDIPADKSDIVEIQLKNTTWVNFNEGEKYKISCWVYVDAEKDKKLNSIQFILCGKKWTAAPPIEKSTFASGEWVKLTSDELVIAAGQSGGYAPYIKAYFPVVSDEDPVAEGKDEPLLMYLDDVEIIPSIAASSITAPESAKRLFVVAGNGGLNIIGAPQGELVEVYNLSGVRVATEAISSSSHFVAAQSGIYIVRMGHEVVKVIL